MDQSAGVADKTMSKLTARTSLAGRPLSAVLRGLESRDPPLVTHDVDAKLGTKVWWATNAGGDAMDHDA
jgi:hypothetical protein